MKSSRLLSSACFNTYSNNFIFNYSTLSIISLVTKSFIVNYDMSLVSIMCKLKYEDKIKMYKEYKNGIGYSALAKKYNINKSTTEYLIYLIDKHCFNVLRKKIINIILNI